MKYIVSNRESDIKDLLLQLKNEYGDYAFISYIDGEYGTRVYVYNSLVRSFYQLMKIQNIPCIGITFKNTTCFLNNNCDHIIEIDDVEFYSNTCNPFEDNSQTSRNHYLNVVPKNSYYGNDGWNLVYIRGIHSYEYENILNEINFANIFYTLHLDGSNTLNSTGNTTGIFCKINNDNTMFHYNTNTNNLFSKPLKEITCPEDELSYKLQGPELYASLRNIAKLIMHSYKFIKKDNEESIRYKTDNIAIWIRNTNKWPSRNTPAVIYNTLFSYCIITNKKCYVFQDLIPIDIPQHENIIECNNRIKNRPDFDNFIKICSECDIYVGANSGPYYLLLHQCFPILKICHDYLEYCDDNTKYNVKDENTLIDILNEFYTSP